jgi:hydroxyacylglutathione hydrolase
VIFDRRRYGQDNYTYLIADSGDGALIDPGDPEVALALSRDHGVRPRFVLHTHGHLDHTGGTRRVASALGATVYGSEADQALYRPDVDVRGEAVLDLGALRVRVHEVPGHTPGSVLFEWKGLLFTGDTLFWGGAGNCRNGGDPARLADSFLGVLGPLDDALVVHPGHDYAEANLPFALDLEPANESARERLGAAQVAHASGREPEAPTLGEERRANPFLRAGLIIPVLARRGRVCRDAREAFVALRALRDLWRSSR